jgi:Leucine-rich repeat (LRR) protein
MNDKEPTNVAAFLSSGREPLVSSPRTRVLQGLLEATFDQYMKALFRVLLKVRVSFALGGVSAGSFLDTLLSLEVGRAMSDRQGSGRYAHEEEAFDDHKVSGKTLVEALRASQDVMAEHYLKQGQWEMVGLVRALQLAPQQTQILLLQFDLEEEYHGVDATSLAMAVEGIGSMGVARRAAVEALYTQVCAAESALQAANVSSLTNASKSSQRNSVVPSLGLLRDLLAENTPQTPALDGMKDEWCHMVEQVVRGSSALSGTTGTSKKNRRGGSPTNTVTNGGVEPLIPRLMFQLWMTYWSIWSDATSEDGDFLATVKVVAGEARSRSLFATPQFASVVGSTPAIDLAPSASPQKYPRNAQEGKSVTEIFVTQLLQDLGQGSQYGDNGVGESGHNRDADPTANGSNAAMAIGGGSLHGENGEGTGTHRCPAPLGRRFDNPNREERGALQSTLQEEAAVLADLEQRLVPFLASLLDRPCACLSSLFLGAEHKMWPKVISLLRRLEWLWVDHNALHTLPSAICTLENLHFLDVSSNALSKFPPSIRCLQKLHTLRASGNFLCSVPDEMCELGALRELVLTSNKLRSLPQRLSNCAELRVLLLDNNELSGPCPTVISSLAKLHKLAFNNNKITSLPNDIGHCLKELRVLEAHSNSIQSLPTSLGNVDTLSVLLLHRNRIGPRIPEYVFSPGLGLEYLTLHCNLLEELPTDVFELPRLASLSVHSNRLKRFPNSLSQAMSLQELDAHSNHLTHRGFPSLLPRSLTSLSLYANKLTEIPKACIQIPFCVRDTGSDTDKHHTLEVLRLQRNVIHKIPNNIGDVKSLRCLNLARNKISEVPTSIGDMPVLTELFLEGNPLCDPLHDIVSNGRYQNQHEINLDKAIEKLLTGMTNESVMNEMAKLKEPPKLSKGDLLVDEDDGSTPPSPNAKNGGGNELSSVASMATTGTTHRRERHSTEAPSYETTALRHKSRYLGRVLRSLYAKYWELDGGSGVSRGPKVQFERTSLDEKQVEGCRRCFLRVAPTLSPVQLNSLLLNMVELATEGEEVVVTLGDRTEASSLPPIERIMFCLEKYLLSRASVAKDPTNAVIKWCRHAKRIRRYQSFRNDQHWTTQDEDHPMLLATATGGVNAHQRAAEEKSHFLSKSTPQPAPTSPGTTVREVVLSSTVPTSGTSKSTRSQQQHNHPRSVSATAVRGSSRYHNQLERNSKASVATNKLDTKQERQSRPRGSRSSKVSNPTSKRPLTEYVRDPVQPSREGVQARVSKEISELEKTLNRHEMQLTKMFSQGNPQARLQQLSQKLNEDGFPSRDFEHGRIRPPAHKGGATKKRTSEKSVVTSSAVKSKWERDKALAASLMQALAARSPTRQDGSDRVPISILPVGEDFAQLHTSALELRMSLSARILDLKAEVFVATGIEPTDQILLFKGRRLEDNATLHDCKMEARAQLRLIVGKTIDYTGNGDGNMIMNFASSRSGREGIPHKSALRSGGSRSAERIAPKEKEQVRFSTASPEVRTRPWTPFEDVRDMFYTEEEVTLFDISIARRPHVVFFVMMYALCLLSSFQVNYFRAEAERESMEMAMFEYAGEYEDAVT